jgi:hypothetical protein
MNTTTQSEYPLPALARFGGTILDALVALWRRFSPVPTQPAPTPHRPAGADSVSVSRQIRKRRSVRKENHVDGDYLSIGGLLDDLDNSYDVVRRLRPDDALLRNFGVYMVGDYAANSGVRKDSLDIQPGAKLPATMMVYLRTNDDDILQSIRFAIKRNWDIRYGVARPKAGWFYEFGSKNLYKGSVYTAESFIEIDPVTNNPRLLAFRDSQCLSLPRGNNDGHYHAQSWKTSTLPPPKCLEDKGEYSRADLEAATLDSFCLIFNLHRRREASTNIHAVRGKSRMVFSVPMHTWKDFFKDRVTGLASDGRRKRIFHHVAAHTRKNGQTVPPHMRGLTRFKWGKYRIKIVEQKRGRKSHGDFDLACEGFDDASPGPFMDAGKASELLVEKMTEDLHKPGEGSLRQRREKPLCGGIDSE